MSESDTRPDEGAEARIRENELEGLRQEKEELRQKCFDLSAKIRVLEAQLQSEKDLTCRAQRELAKVKGRNGQISLQLKSEDDENSRLKYKLEEERSATSKLYQELKTVKDLNAKISLKLEEAEKEIGKLSSVHCTKKGCLWVWSQFKEKEAEVVNLRAVPCFKDECVKKVKNLKEAEEQLTVLHADSCSKYQEIQRLTAENTRLSLLCEKHLPWLQSELDKKNQQLEESRNEKDKQQSEGNALAQEAESQTCKGCPCVHLRSDLLHILGGGIVHSETQERITFTDTMLRLANGQNKILAKLTEQQQHSGTESHASSPCKNKQCMQTMRSFRAEIDDLKRQLFSEQCQRAECVKLRKDHRQQVVQSIGSANPGKDLDKQRAVEHEQLVHEFESLTTDLDGLLGVLEDTLRNGDANFQAKRLLCTLFQEAYDRSKKIVIHAISSKLESLFEVQKTKTEEMEDASRGYGLLLSAFSLRMKEIRAQHSDAIKVKMFHEFSSGGNETFQKIKAALERSPKDHLGKAIELAWKFVTIPNPLIVCQPEKYDSQIHSPEHGYWDSKRKHESNLIYTRPVVYRNYEGVLACKGWVADKDTGEQHSQQSESSCSLS